MITCHKYKLNKITIDRGSIEVGHSKKYVAQISSSPTVEVHYVFVVIKEVKVPVEGQE